MNIVLLLVVNGKSNIIINRNQCNLHDIVTV